VAAAAEAARLAAAAEMALKAAQENTSLRYSVYLLS
jgi:hypothetical protein